MPSKTMSPDAQLRTFLAKYTPEIEKIAKKVLVRMRKRLPNAIQLVYDNYNALAIGFGPSERPSEAIFSIAVFPRWVSLFFLQARHLRDPKKLLQGSGSVARHIVLNCADDLDGLAIKDLIEQALRTAKVPMNPEERGRVVIRSISAKQRPRRPAEGHAKVANSLKGTRAKRKN